MSQYSYPSAYVEVPHNPPRAELPHDPNHVQLPSRPSPGGEAPPYVSFRAELPSPPYHSSPHTSPPSSLYHTPPDSQYSSPGSHYSSLAHSQYTVTGGSQFSLPLRPGPPQSAPHPPSSISPNSLSPSNFYGPPSSSSTFHTRPSFPPMNTVAELPAEISAGPPTLGHSYVHRGANPQGYQHQYQTMNYPPPNSAQAHHFNHFNHFTQNNPQVQGYMQAQYQTFNVPPPNPQVLSSYGQIHHGQQAQTMPLPNVQANQSPYVQENQTPYMQTGQLPVHSGQTPYVQLDQPPLGRPDPVPHTSPPPTSHSHVSNSNSQTSSQSPPYVFGPPTPASSDAAPPRPPGGIKMLCLDGGGVRGLASLYLLKQLLSYAGHPKPCEFFDIIGGTSTGGLIAILLGRLRLSIDNCIETFSTMMDTIFKKKHSMVRSIVSGQVQPRFDASILESAIKEVISDAGFHREERFRIDSSPEERHNNSCKTFVVALTQESTREVLLTSYPRPGEQSTFYSQIKIWEAARATSAATSFFAPIKITYGSVTREFLDGAFAANNPVNKLWSEARELYPTGLKLPPSLSPIPSSFESNIHLLLSIGTGRPPLREFGTSLSSVGNSIIRIAAETQATADQFLENHEELAARGGYFRFNPPDLYREVGLEESGKRNLIMERTEAYGGSSELKGVVRLFKSVVAGSYVSAPPPISIIPAHSPPVIRSFYELGAGDKYIRRNNDSYWRHLTLASYEVYEKIWRECRSANGLVHYRTFTQQFNSDRPSPSQVRNTWSRLLRDKSQSISDSCHPKGFVLACLYMLHMETSLENEFPVDEHGEKGKVTQARRELLKRYGNWVHCRCGGSSGSSSGSSSGGSGSGGSEGCTVEWCFANDLGLCRGPEAVKKVCECVKLQDKTRKVSMLFAGKAARQFAETRAAWEGSLVSKR